jgi:nucleotide-binding universal stress UspA family protein
MYQRILVPLDGSTLAEVVLPHVQALAKSLGVKHVLRRTSVPMLLMRAAPPAEA